jgi:outer membrane protein assembly factor BamA
MFRRRILTSVTLIFALLPVGVALASECESPVEAVASQEPTLITILDTDVGTEAFERLVSYADGGHETLGRAIGQAHNWFGACEYVGVGIGYGSGGNGYRPNFTLALWRTGIDETTTRNAVYQLIGASQNPTVTTNDCTTSCTTSTPVTPETTTSPFVSAEQSSAECDSPSIAVASQERYCSTTDSVTSSKTTAATKPAAKKSPKTIVKRKSERSRKVAPKKSRVLR